MSKARQKMEGESVGYLARLVYNAILEPTKLESAIDKLNPFKERKPESAALKAHRKKIADLKFKAAVAGGK